MAFMIDDALLRRLCAINAFAHSDRELVFFGLRGCLPVGLDSCGTFRKEHKAEVQTPDYNVPRCTLGQWKPADKTLALFPGSTVPHIKDVTAARAKLGAGANQLMTGFYKDYRKGMHKAGTETGHDAFRQSGQRPIRRTADDLDYEQDDRIEIENPGDNFHAGWCMSPEKPYSSAGCQVVVGYPKCARPGRDADTGPWAVFKATAYDDFKDQQRFQYILLLGRDAQSVAEGGRGKVPARLRFGSSGPLVGEVQKALAAVHHYEGDIDEDVGPRTLRAVLSFQDSFGAGAGDGIIGSQTASALGIDPWPKL